MSSIEYWCNKAVRYYFDGLSAKAAVRKAKKGYTESQLRKYKLMRMLKQICNA